MTKNVLCRHCENTCKKFGKIDCDKYMAIADRPQRLKKEIKEAFAQGNYKLAKELQNKL